MRAYGLLPLVAFVAATPLAAQQQRVVRGLAFDGNHALDSYTLSTAIATSQSGWLARAWPFRLLGLGEKRYLNELELRRDVVRLVLLYRQSGYMGAAVDTVVRRDSSGKNAWVTFKIAEGPPVRVTKLTITGADSAINVRALRRELPLQVGDPFNRFLFQAAADTIIDALRNAGYPYADVLRNFDTDAATDSAEITLDVLPGPRVHIGAIAVEGVSDIDTTTVRRALSVHPGDLYHADRLLQSQRDLYGLGVFRAASVVLVDSTAPGDPGDSTVRLLVRVQEGPRHGIRLGAGYGTADCLRVQGGWTLHDFFGGGRTFDLSARVSKLGVGYPTDAGLRKNVCNPLKHDPFSDTLNYNFTASLLQPAIFSPRHTASLGVFVERRSEAEAYTRQAVGFNAAVTFNARRTVPVTVGYGFSVGHTSADAASYCSVFRLCDSTNQAFLSRQRRFAAVTVTAVRSRVNSILSPSEGGSVTLTLLHSSRVVGSDPFYEFNRGELEVARYYPLSRRSTLAWRVRGGTILPQRITLSAQSAQFVPPEQRFYAGGPNSVRGFGLNELGPKAYVTTDSSNITVNGADTTYRVLHTAPTGGNTAVVANLELRVPAPVWPDRMKIGLFVDAGQVWNRGSEAVSLNTVRVTPGIGLRYATPLGPVRLDVAYDDYASELGPLFYEDPNTGTLHFHSTYQPARPGAFLHRLALQIAVGEAF